MPTRRRPELARTTVLAAVATVAASILLVGAVQGAGHTVAGAAVQAWHSIFGDRAPVALGSRTIVVLSSPSLAERVAAASSSPGPRQERRWVADIEAEQQALLGALRRRGIAIHRDEVFTRTLNGFSAALDARATAELERNPGVVGLYPVRAVYPAETGALRSPGPGAQAGVRLPGLAGRGVTVALLDTGVDESHPGLAGRVLRGFDLVGRDLHPDPESDPADAARVETHGTRMAGLVAAVAPRATILPIRVVGWEPGTDGTTSLVGRGDQLIAGLERAVDPNRDGSVADAARIALAPLVEPFAAFPDSPESRAVAGATALGTLVVAATGNDGSSGIGFGSIGAPAAAADALAVGAFDNRVGVPLARASLVAGGKTLFSGPLRVLGKTALRAPTALEVAGLLGPSLAEPSRPAGSAATGSSLGDFFDTAGVSRVAGRAAVVAAGGAPLEQAVRNAQAAGAVALFVAGTALPPGALDFDDATALPVLSLPGAVGAEVTAALRDGGQVSALVEPGGTLGNDGLDRVAPFSSGGLAFDGRVKPDVVAPGVGLATLDAGAPERDGPRYATVSGTSAAAAVTAGAAALVAEARPQLTAAELGAVLVGSASPLADPQAVTREGAGRIDPAAAAAAELAIEPASLSFGRASGTDWSATRTMTVENVSTRPLEVGLGLVADQPGEARVSFSAKPAHLSLGPGASAEVQIGATAGAALGGGASGVLVASAPGARPARVPWSLAPRPGQAHALVDSVSLSNWEFEPSKNAPAVLAFRAGTAASEVSGERIEPVGLLDVELWTTHGKLLGSIARLRDLLPGRYAFGLTGRGPDGKVLKPGLYLLRLRAQPVDAADGTPAATADTVFRITN